MKRLYLIPAALSVLFASAVMATPAQAAIADCSMNPPGYVGDFGSFQARGFSNLRAFGPANGRDSAQRRCSSARRQLYAFDDLGCEAVMNEQALDECRDGDDIVCRVLERQVIPVDEYNSNLSLRIQCKYPVASRRGSFVNWRNQFEYLAPNQHYVAPPGV